MTPTAQPVEKEQSSSAFQPPAEELPENLEADFAPLQTEERSAKSLRTDPYHQDSLLAQQAFDRATQAATEGKEEEAVHDFLSASKLAEQAHEWYLAALSFRRVGDFLISPRPPCDLERALRMYRRAIDAYHRCGLVDEARQLSYAVLYFRMVRGRELGMHWHRRLELWVFWAVAGFGHRPLRVVGLATVFVLLFGVLYRALGGVVHPATAQAASLWECVYFSGITFTTIGYGDFVPTPTGRPFAMFEGAIGALTVGFFVAVLINRLRR